MQLASLGVSRTRQCNLQVRTSEAGQDILVCFAGLLISLKSIINDCPKYLIFIQI